MEHKVWVKIFALLLLGLSALALHDNETSPHSTAAPGTPAAPGLALTPGPMTVGPGSGPSLDESSPSNNNSSSTEAGPGSSLNDTAEEVGPTTTNSSETLDVNGTIPVEATSLPALPNQTFATQSQQTTASPSLSSTNKTENSSLPTSATNPEISNTSQPEATPQNFTHTTQLIPSTRTSASTTTATATAIITSTASTTTSTASTTASTTTTTTTTATALESTQAPADKETSTRVQSAGVTHKPITPSQLNVGEETTVVHEGPTLDPLLAGLVSAFIIAAVIITLLLFLKLRRRDSRPEFRRLQDLPMDDMMEDTPLSMYSY